jgi:hypothetical protein
MLNKEISYSYIMHSSILRRIWFNFMAQYLFFRLFHNFHNFLDFNFFGLSTTDETCLVEMCIWCIKIGIVLVLHYNTHLGVKFLFQHKVSICDILCNCSTLYRHYLHKLSHTLNLRFSYNSHFKLTLRIICTNYRFVTTCDNL